MVRPALSPTAASPPTYQWDIYCWVVDNFGDAGVCLRLARDLVGLGHRVRLFINDADALDWLATDTDRARITVLPWSETPWDHGHPPDVIVEAFGCDLPDTVVSAIAAAPQTTWINLEYLSAEPYAAACHGLASPVMSGPAKGHVKWFFYPGFTPDTGGLLGPEPDPLQDAAHPSSPAAWVAASPLPKVGVFSYESPGLETLVSAARAGRIALFAASGRSAAAIQQYAAVQPPAPPLVYLEPMSQPQFDAFLAAMDINVVRGEDSLVRALWTGKPFIWHIYPQDDGAHHVKLRAFLDWLSPPAEVRALMTAWNQPTTSPAQIDGLWTRCQARTVYTEWEICVQGAVARLSQQWPLAQQLAHFVWSKKRLANTNG